MDNASSDAAVNKVIVGIDEVGRGCLAGPVSACAYAFRTQDVPAQLKDSKKLSAKKRISLIPTLEQSGWFGHGSVDSKGVDLMGILPANFLAMRQALDEFKTNSGLQWCEMDVVVDGNILPTWADIPAGVVRCLIKADDTVKAVSAASVLAKVRRDAWMAEIALELPGYGFEDHAGYGTAAHIDAIFRLGPTPIHRMTFAPLKTMVSTASP